MFDVFLCAMCFNRQLSLLFLRGRYTSSNPCNYIN